MEMNGTERASLSETEKRKHRCCFTGHRPEKLQCEESEARALLVVHIRSAYSHGFTTFISGMAQGIDLWAADRVCSREEHTCSYHQRGVKGMSDRKKPKNRKRAISMILMVSLFLVGGIWGLHAYRDYSSCICFGVTAQPQTRAIDDRLRSWYEIDENAETFSITMFTCPHNKRLGLRIYPFNNTYDIWLRD